MNKTPVVQEEFERSVPDRFEEQVRMHPDRLAFKTTKDALTWDALNQAANRVARAILGMCEGQEKPVALLLDREASTMVASMGVLKTGGFYVPLAPSHPSARIGYILNETEAAFIVTDNKCLTLASEVAPRNCRLLNIEELAAGLSTENIGLSISPDSLTSITYTSGSTGEPKGVINTHRRDLHRTTHDKQFGLGPDDRYTNVGSAERRSPFNALLNGAASFPWYVRDEGLAHLADWLIREEITVLRSGPRVFRHFVSTLTGEEKFPKLRVINLAGEPVFRADIELYKKHFPANCVLVNTYGAHEVGPIRLYIIGKETKITGEKVPVGYAIPDKEVLLLDDEGREIGFDQVGQIVVKSRFLSPGYWRRPDLTEAKFLPGPQGGDCRTYLTGDLGRMSRDGCLEHLGRKDFQVKIRGLRVEIGEVEAALRSMEEIREAVVVAREEKRGDKCLIAYFVPAGHGPLGISAVRNFIEQKLPVFMVPSKYIMLDALPLTPNGKINRQALPDPDKSRPDLETPFVAPRTSMEQQLSQIWAGILSLEQVGVHDSFIELGGHSLSAAQVISQVIKTFQVELPLQSLFEAPTIAEMATVITQNHVKKIGHDELARMLTELDSLSDEEARRLVAKETAQKRGLAH